MGLITFISSSQPSSLAGKRACRHSIWLQYLASNSALLAKYWVGRWAREPITAEDS